MLDRREKEVLVYTERSVMLYLLNSKEKVVLILIFK